MTLVVVKILQMTINNVQPHRHHIKSLTILRIIIIQITQRKRISTVGQRNAKMIVKVNNVTAIALMIQ